MEVGLVVELAVVLVAEPEEELAEALVGELAAEPAVELVEAPEEELAEAPEEAPSN
jgi:hypothetical protein